MAENIIAVNCYNQNDYAYKKFYLEEGLAGACINDVWVGHGCRFSAKCPGGNYFCGYSNLSRHYNCVGEAMPYFYQEGDWFITCGAGERCPHVTYPSNGLDWFCSPAGALYPIRSQVKCALYEAEAPLLDVRTPEMIENGCCPINHDTGLPFDDGFPDSEDRGKNGGESPNSCSTGIFQGNPINVATGNKFEKSLDLTISTPGIPLEFRRSYNSQITFDSPLGYGWTHSYNVSLGVVQTSPTKRIRIWDSDGRALYFSEVQQSSTEILFGGESGVKDRLKHIISTGEYFLRRRESNLIYKFASDGRLTQISDPNGNTLTFSYTGGLLTQVSDNFGKSLWIQYLNNRITSITDPKNQSILYEYTSGDLTKVTYPDTNVITYAYSNHNLTDKYDTNNNLIGHWGYDNRHRVISYYSHIKDSVPQERIDLTYQLGGTVVTRSTGTTTYTTAVIDGIDVVQEIQSCSTCGAQHKRLAYSPRLDVTSVTYIKDGLEITTQYVYDNPANPWEQIGEVLQKTEAVGLADQRTTNYSYTHSPNDPLLVIQRTETRKSVVDPNNNRTSTSTYDTQGKLLSQEETGYVLIGGVPTLKTYRTEYQYNALGQLIQINGPRTDVSDITTQEYYENSPSEGNNRSQLKAIVNALEQRTEFSDYDANGNVGRITDPNGVVTIRTYDERNRIKTITNQATGVVTQYLYDSHGNLQTVILPEGSRIDSTYDLANRLLETRDNFGNKIIYQYDQEGNRIREETKDPQGILKKYLDFTYDANGRLKGIINPDGTYTEYTYDSLGNRTITKDPKNYITNYSYDSLRRLKDMTQPLSVITQYVHDTQDNQTSVTDPKGNITQYQYDDFGRRNQTASPDTGTTKYLYDEVGNLIQRTDAKGIVVNYTYDALNRVTSVQFSDPSQNIAYTYDSTSVTYRIGKLTGRTDSSGSYTFYYDAQGNMIKEEKNISNVLYTTQYVYDLENILTSITYPSGRTVNYRLDQVGRIAQVSTTLNGNPKTLASAISYLPYGGITGLNYGNGLSLNHGYDNQYRTSSIIVGSIMNRTYEYDPNGNITSILDPIEPSGNEIFEDAGTYTYQHATNKLTQVQGELNVVYGYDANGNITSANNRTYIYDLSNRLIRVEDNAVTSAEYVYNANNQRIKKIVQGATRIFHYDISGHLIAETSGTRQTLAEYIYVGNQLLAMIRPGEAAYYYHNDHLGTPQILTDEAGTVSWKAVYTPFGEADILVETIENPFRFPGQYYDQETGLHYNWNRYYDPKTGRYLSPDPIGLEGGINLFVYVVNNPINFADPPGLTDRYTYCKGIPGCKEATNKACSSSVQAAMLCCKYDFDGCLIDIGYPACEEWDQNQCIAKYLQCLKNAKPKKERNPLEPPLPVPPNPPYPGNPKTPYPPS
jgi:RHS repeat-associated protein